MTRRKSHKNIKHFCAYCGFETSLKCDICGEYICTECMIVEGDTIRCAGCLHGEVEVGNAD
jgi:hypothetical protein